MNSPIGIYFRGIAGQCACRHESPLKSGLAVFAEADRGAIRDTNVGKTYSGITVPSPSSVRQARPPYSECVEFFRCLWSNPRMRTLYFDCFAGASGNMILGALIDLGVDEIALGEEIAKLGLEGVSIETTKVDRSGISSTHVEVLYPEQHHHRHLADIDAIIDGAQISGSVKERGKSIFQRLAGAEAQVHGIPMEKVHFHEVGALDAIVDIVGACIAFELLGIEEFTCSRMNAGSGFVEMSHGRYPVPPPAVAELVKGFEIYSEGIEGELLTPTGAAIITELCNGSSPFPQMKVESTGYGAGTRHYERFPNVLRLVLGEAGAGSAAYETERLRLIETNIDDSTPQTLGYVLERTLELGALDCWITPVQMKKNRPASVLSVLARPEAETEIKRLIFTETSTIGLRVRDVARECLARSVRVVRTRFGDVDVKEAIFEGKVVNRKPEFDQITALAESNGVPVREVEKAVASELENESSFKAKG